MAASVRIEDEAFSDLRFDVLANACQLADADHARGKMAALWRQCTLQRKYVLPRAMIAAVLGPSGPAGIVESGLGEEHHEGIRIRGTEGRIEWLDKLRANAIKGGMAKAAKRQPVGSQEAGQEAASAVPPPCPPTPTPTPAPVSSYVGDAREADALAPIKAKAARAPKEQRKHPLPSDWEPNDTHRAKAGELRIDLRHEADQFRSHALANGKRFADWDAAFRTWLGNAAKWRDERGGSRQAALTEIRTNLQPL